MKWALVATGAAVAAIGASRPVRRSAGGFVRDIQTGMAQRESQLRQALAVDTHLTLPGERTDDARAIEGR